MKDLKISKKLLKAVLQKETEALSKGFNFTLNDNYIEFSDNGELLFEYCIYKFTYAYSTIKRIIELCKVRNFV